MVTDFLSAPFLQNAGRAGKEKSIIRFMCGEEADPTIQQIVCDGAITIKSTKDSAPVSATYPAGTHDAIVVQADENTEVVIAGNVTELYITKHNDDPDVDDYEGYMSLASIDVSGCKKLQTLCIAINENVEALDLSTNTALQYLYCGSTGLTALDLSTNTALQYLYCGSTGLTALDLSTNTALQHLYCGSTGLTALDLSTNTALQTLYCNNCTSLVEIKYAATNEDVSTAVAGAITDADAADGTVYTDSAADYYSTIETAATAKGWTIEQIA